MTSGIDLSAPQDLSPTEREARMHAKAETVIDCERRHILGRAPTDKDEWWGIGLSGGGIRSASLALGVLQSMAERDLLKCFQFLSSVSGGGYIGCSLQWWWSQGRLQKGAAAFGAGAKDFPYGPAYPTSDPVESPVQQGAAQNLTFLRAHSAYLTPGHGLNIWSMIGVLLRTIVIAVATWLPLLGLAMGVLFLVDYLLADWVARYLRLPAPLADAMPAMWAKPDSPVPLELQPFRYRAIFALPLLLSYLSIAAFVAAAFVFALVSRAPQNATAPRRLGKPILSVAFVAGLAIGLALSFKTLDVSTIFVIAALIVFAAVAATTAIGDYVTEPDLTPSYMLRRRLETLMGRLFIPTLVALALGTIPYLPYYIASSAPTHGFISGLFGMLSGVAAALYGYYTFLRNLVPSLVGQIAATVGAILYLYATLVFAYLMIVILVNPGVLAAGANAEHISLAIRIGIPFSMLLALAIATWGNINFVGLHRFYRDRLMEAFMPTTASVAEMTSQFSPAADNLQIAALAPLSTREGGLPYPIINTNAILINDPHRKYASRGGDNFIISPLFVGSTATGWQPTPDYINENGPLTLATAMAASGAAASASAGYIGAGITMNKLVSAVMSLLNIRLGLWTGNPRLAGIAKRRERIPTFLHPGLVSGIFQQAHTFDSKYLELTDGGHFENLALYELVRRRAKIIVIVDGEADPKISLSSLVSAKRRIEEDFGAQLDFEPGMGPDRLMMYPKQRYPSDSRYAAAPFMVGRLTYRHAKETDGLLVYIKSTLFEQVDFATSGYLASNPDFPHQSTVDQFFDPAQFDAYRCLGYESAELAFTALKTCNALDDYPSFRCALTRPIEKGASL